MIQKRKLVNKISDATRPAIETLEARKLLSATLSVSSSLMVFNAVENSSVSPTETLTLINTGNADLTLGSSAFSLVNDPNAATQDAARFSDLNVSSAPATLAPEASFTLQLDYNSIAITTNSALLNISTNDPANPTQAVTLHGIGTRGLGGTNQPSLATILQAYDIPTYVGEGFDDANAATDSTYPNPPDSSSQEVVMQRFVKAGSGPITINVLASFTASGFAKSYTLGTYTPGEPTTLNELFYTTSSENQTTYVQPQGSTSFDPGSNPFGFYFISNVQTQGRVGYSEDALNTWDTTNPRKMRFFPMEEPNGTIVPDTYIMTSTEWNAPGGYDFTNIVAVVSNITAAPGSPTQPVLGLQNLNALPGSVNMVFTQIQNQNTSVGDTFHDIGTLQVNNTGDSPLILNSYTISSQWQLVNPPTFPVSIAAGADLDLSIKFTATTAPSVPYNETNETYAPTGGGVYSGTLTLNSNDPNNPTASMPLTGYWQYHSENSDEPSFQTIVNLMEGCGTYVNSTPLPDLTESLSTSSSTPTYYGEEVASYYWQEADTTAPVTVQQIAAYHTQGNTAETWWYTKGSSGSLNELFETAADDGQTIFPDAINTTTPAEASFNTTSVFGFKVDSLYSDDTLNTGTANGQAGGHHFRFYPVRYANGELVPNDYLVAYDYSTSDENFDFQDNVYLVSNIRPATLVSNISNPQSTEAPPAPTDAVALSSDGVNTVTWAPVLYTDTSGYNVFRTTSTPEGGTYTQLNTNGPISVSSFTDSAAPVTGTSYYKVEAVDSVTGTHSFGDITSVLNTGTVVSGNGAPVAAAESATTMAGNAVTIHVLANATDNSNGTVQAADVLVTTRPANGTASVNTSTGSITYTPAAGFTGTDTFQYTVGDSTGAVSSPATATITVTAIPVGDPIAANLSYTTVPIAGLLIDDVAAATDSTAMLEPSTVTIVRAPSHGTATVNSSTGAIAYVATSGYSGSDSFQYTIGDSLGAVSQAATITLTVQSADPIAPVTPIVATGPVVTSFSVPTTTIASNTIDVISSANDSTGAIVASGVAVTTAPQHGIATIDPLTGAIVYTAAGGYIGSDSLQYTLTDSNGVVSSPATLSLNVGVSINNTSAKSLTFTDSANDKVTMALTGGGVAEILFNGAGTAQTIKGAHGTGSILVSGTALSVSDISITGSTIKSVLTISRHGVGTVALGDISVDGAIGKILAPASTLTGTLAVGGATTLLQLGSANGATITVGPSESARASFSLTGTHMLNTTLISDMPINSIKVTDWTVSDTADSIIAPSIATLTTTGDFQALLNTDGGSPFSLGTARIGGQVDAEGWDIAGAANSISVGSVAPGWVGNFSGALNNFSIRAGGFAGTLIAASISNLTITGNDTGTVTAGSIKSARIAGELSGASVTTTNGVLPKSNSLGRLTIAGTTLGSTIYSAGNIGSISTDGVSGSSIDAGTADGVTLPSASGNFASMAIISSFSVVGRGSTFANSSIGAESLGSLNLGTVTTGNGGNPFGVGASKIKSVVAVLSSGGVLRLSGAELLSEMDVSAYLNSHALSTGDFLVVPGV